MRLIFTLIFFIFAFPARAAHPRWYEPTNVPIKGIALVVHGLNVFPQKMEEIIQQLNRRGIAALNVTLSGHDPANSYRFYATSQVKAFTWMSEFREAYHLSEARAEDQNVAHYFVGYSLGGLLSVSSIIQDEGIQFEKMVLFAPAIKLRWYTKIIKPLQPWPELQLPSFSSKSYRANRYNAMAVYKSLFGILSTLDDQQNYALLPPSLVFCARSDELVSFGSIKKFIQRKNLDRWTLDNVRKEPKAGGSSYKHIIIDQSSVGNEEWQRMWNKIDQFLDEE